MLRYPARLLIRLARWRVEGELPPDPKVVVIGAPHTSNWDFLVFLAALAHFGIRVRFIGKDSLFRPPLGWLLRALGGIPVQRDRSERVVARIAERFAAADRMWLVIAPEGTRRRRPAWRSGFYRIAEAAGVPILLTGMDFPTRRAVVGPVVSPTGDVRADMDRIRAFYAPFTGKHPDWASDVRLEAER